MPLCSLVSVLFSINTHLLFANYVHCLFSVSPYYNIISTTKAQFFCLFCSLISLKADSGGWHLVYAFGGLNKLTTHKIQLGLEIKQKWISLLDRLQIQSISIPFFLSTALLNLVNLEAKGLVSIFIQFF